MTYWTGPGHRGAGDGRAQLRASDADRERASEVLKSGFADGRLTKEEYDAHLSQVYAARTNADLMAVTSQLPGGGLALYAPEPPPRTNPLAVAALVCGIAQFFTLGLATIPAVILGHMSHRQIRRTGEQGSGMATAGLVLGWIGVALWVIFITLVLFAAVSVTHGGSTTVVPGPPGP
jgi:Domain of unknown function (DUF4190)/Domain of unknown function (DUF1707)